jgi:hypothetical protein
MLFEDDAQIGEFHVPYIFLLGYIVKRSNRVVVLTTQSVLRNGNEADLYCTFF